MTEPARSDSLQPALQRAQAELAKHLDQACEVGDGDIARGSVDELLQLEEELLAAARAADEAVRLRKRLGERAEHDAGRSAGGDRRFAPEAPSDDKAGGQVREFRDREGRAWRVWAVRPGLGRPMTELHRYLGEYLHGWLAFGCLDDDRRKRLPNYPPDWFESGDRELQALLERAADVPERKR